MVQGFDRSIEPLRALPGDPSAPRRSLEAVLLRALLQPPCIVSFSGGRDSSAMLGLAVHVARREGLPMPIPATLRVLSSAAAEESEWQELVIDHLQVDDWLRIDVTDQLDVVGPVATRALARHGLLWPFNTHFHIPMFEHAGRGSVVTGFGGDELGLSTSTARAERILAERRIRRRSDLFVLGLAVSPRSVRRAVHTRRQRRELEARPWLTPLGVRRVAREAGRTDAAIPLGWSRVLRDAIWRGRYFRMCQYSFEVAASAYGTSVVHPLLDPDLLSALAGVGGFSGVGDRTALMELLFGDLLPRETLERSSKASFDDAMWTGHARAFAAAWSGEGLPKGLVDGGALRAHWLHGTPHALSAVLMQAAWVHDHAGT
jgi:asparagine synthase (glutamine-hydrolysing)